ncbi:MAG: DNRLRE domain-containing protein [Planctomycetota bacterium]|nr:DNRLRE domain-containing protein [Planctomycetota bacterium]
MRITNLFSQYKQPRQISRKRHTQRTFAQSIESLESRVVMAVATFQDGLGAYAGTQDTILFSTNPDVNFGSETGISVDQQDVNGVRQGLLRFDGIIGAGVTQIPVGSQINSATLTVSVFNDSNTAMQMSMYRMRSNWSAATATWNSFGSIGGIQASQGEVEGLPPDAILFDSSVGTKTFDVTTSLKHWAAGETNLGWLFESASTNGWDFNSSEADPSNRPRLTVDFTPPPAGATGSAEFINLIPMHSEGDAGTTTANLTVARAGGTSGTLNVPYTITAGTATASDFVAAGPLNLTFLPGETLKTIPVTINGDTSLEGLETINVTMSGAIVAGRNVATLTIADDDALINEVLANVTDSAGESNRDFVELLGTPGASLDGYFFVVFESEEEENGGTGSGIADLVVPLTGQTFGSNGLLVITGTSWAYQSQKDPATNQLQLPAFDVAGGILEDSSQTYALVRSPISPIVQGTDYDTQGAYENNQIGAQLSIGTGVGILDQLPAGAQIVDSVGVVEGGGNDRDRIATVVGHPGVHVHQPIGRPGDNAASDGVSRRVGARDPNSIGVWFNGDVFDGAAVPLAYANGTPQISVVAPAGSVVTPGAANTLRNVFFDVKAENVDESAGTVTLTVSRSDATTSMSVQYATSNSTAVAGADYTAKSGNINFLVGETSKDIVIDILGDSVAEGFESFRVTLSNPTTPFLITSGVTVVTIVDGDVLVRSFQDDVDGYQGTKDTYLDSSLPDLEFGFASSVIADEERGEVDLQNGDARPVQGLIRFDDMFGTGISQVPNGSKIFSAFLTVNVVSPSPLSKVRFFAMQQGWDEGTSTWSSPQGSTGASVINGVTPDGVEASAEIDAIVIDPSVAGLVDIPLNAETIQAWANGSLPNFGWAIISDSADGWSFSSSDDFLSIIPQPPKLTILYTAPTGQGTLGFSDSSFTVNENGQARVAVQRVGGLTGAASVNYTITPITGSAADITGSLSGTLNFGDPSVTSREIVIPIVNDTLLERNESFTLTLSNPSGATIDAGRATTMLTIRDNDFVPTSGGMLLSEVWINSPGLDDKHEFLELTGTPGAGLGSLYVAIFGGDIGEGEGSTDLVVDLGTFLNGANGHTVVTALNDFGFQVPAGATRVPRLELDTEIVSNDTATYALLYSPNATLLTGAYDYDWDNDGSLELPTGVVIVDSVAVKDNGLTDQTYGPAANVINSALNPNLYVADAVSRLRGNTSRNSAAAWMHGDLTAAGDDGLVYSPTNSIGLPSPGTAMTPGEVNTGTPAISPLVSLTSVTPAAHVGAVTLNFSGPVSQVTIGDGSAGPTGAGITISNPDGTPNGQVNSLPTISGFGTNTLTLTFTGSGVVGGQLPAGQYRLNFVGNSIIANGRAVDTANNGTVTGSSHSVTFTTTPIVTTPGDLNGDGGVDGADVSVVYSSWGGSGVADINGDGFVDGADLAVVFSNWTGDSLATNNAKPAAKQNISLKGNASSVDAVMSQGNEWAPTTGRRGVRPRSRRLTA